MIQNKETMRKADFITGIILLLGGGYFLCESLKMPWKGLSGTFEGEYYTAPGFLPVIITSILMILGAFLTYSAYKEGGRIKRDDLKKVIAALKTVESKRIMIMILIIVFYAFGLISRVHFTLATFLYLTVFMFVFKAGSWYRVLLTAGIVAGVISYAFGNLMQIPLP